MNPVQTERRISTIRIIEQYPVKCKGRRCEWREVNGANPQR